MKILITGGSSFTGYWFIKELAARGHAITAIARGNRDRYEGLRKERIEQIEQWADIVWSCSFGDDTFISLLDKGYDVVCHHGAQVENYKSPDFDIAAALHSNTYRARQVMEALKAAGIGRFIVTGTVFEAGEGVGSLPLVAFSPYGLSKTSSWEVFRYWSWTLSMPVTKFVVPNPFGPYEEPRFCNYLIQTWKKGETPTIGTPDYIRDNIHASLLAKHYAYVVEAAGSAGCQRYGPSGYIESQGAFGVRFAHEMDKRLSLRCSVNLAKQTAFDEPMIRTNDLLLPGTAMTGALAGWDETAAWDELAAYYESHVLR
jgi:nucleoside-diphosphate-sugar epimerase